MLTFRPAFTGLDHALVACDLTQILAENVVIRLNISLESKFNIYYNFYCWSLEQYNNFISRFRLPPASYTPLANVCSCIG